MKVLCVFGIIVTLASTARALPMLQPGEVIVSGIGIAGTGLIRIDPTTGAQTLISSGSFGDFAIADNHTTIYAIESGTVVRIDVATGSKTTVSSGGQLVDPSGIAVDRFGQIQVLDDHSSAGGSGAIVQINPTTGGQTILTSGGLIGPRESSDLEISPLGDLIVLDGYGSGRTGVSEVFAVDITSGQQELLYEGWGYPELYTGTGLGIAPNGDIYASNGTSNATSVVKIDAVTGEAENAGHITGCCWVDSDGIIYPFELMGTDMAFSQDGSGWMTGGGLWGAPDGLWRWDERVLIEDGGVPFSAGNFREVQVVNALPPEPRCVGGASSLAHSQLTTDDPAGSGGDSWLAQIQRGLAEKEYEVSRNSKGLQAPNRAHNLRTYFDATAIRVHDRTQEGRSPLLTMSVAAVGRSEKVLPVSLGTVVSEGKRVEIRRPELLEWYENSAEGIEQGFTFDTRPKGDGPLVVEMQFERAKATLLQGRVIFESETRRRLEYSKLLVTDAKGVQLAAHFELPSGNKLRIQVDDSGATYPVIIDPLLTEMPDSVIESDQMDAQLGWSVSGAGDVDGDGCGDVIIGAPYYDAGEANEGAAFVVLGDPDGFMDANPSNAATQLESNQAGARMGDSVAGAGDVNGDGYDDVIVGAFDYYAGEWNEGAAFVYLGSASGIPDGNPTTAATQIESDQVNAQLGRSVAGAGDVNGDGYADVIVGAFFYDAGQSNEGAAFVYLGSATGIADGNPATAATQIQSNQANARLGLERIRRW